MPGKWVPSLTCSTVTLQLNVKNLFDKTYYTSSIGTNNLGNQIGDPREVQFTVKMEF
jgi:iron complex outermembrane receptor protein